jgi:hypothetical protein
MVSIHSEVVMLKKKEMTKTNFGHLTSKYFFSRFLSIFKNVNFAQKQEAFELQMKIIGNTLKLF